jgi:C4-dicarboxylate-specific signal transduction histidine kinase
VRPWWGSRGPFVGNNATSLVPFLPMFLLVQRRDEEIARLAAENERLAANAMTDDVKQRLKDLEEENASLLDEVRKLRAALRQMTAVRSWLVVVGVGWGWVLDSSAQVL